jgi:hypothetical protein
MDVLIKKITIKSAAQKLEQKCSLVCQLSKLCITSQPLILHPRCLPLLLVEISNGKKRIT